MDKQLANIPNWQRRFIAQLRRLPDVSRAAKAAGISRRHAYRVKAKDEQFAEAWQEAIDVSLDELEGTAFKRAKHGDASLITWLLRCHRPEKYRERSEVAVAGGIVFLPAKAQGDE